MIEQFVHYVLGEIRVILSAPATFLIALIVLGTVIYWALDWRNSGILANREAELALARAQRDDYRDKLGGATPDEVKRRIERLENQLKAMEPRRLSPAQKQIFTSKISGTRGTIQVAHEMACDDCAILADAFVSAIKGVPGWGVSDSAMFNPSEKSPGGIAVLLPNPSAPSPAARVLIDALNAAGFEFPILQGFLSRGEEAQLLFTRKPPQTTN